MENDIQHCAYAANRIRESAIFYIKFDFALMAGLATLASLVKLGPEQVVTSAITFRHVFHMLGWLMVMAVAIEYFSTILMNKINKENLLNQVTLRNSNIALSIAYSLLAFGHVLLLIGATAYISGYLDCAANCGA